MRRSSPATKSLFDRVWWVGITVDRVTSRDVPARRFSLYDRVWRVEIKHLQTLIMHPDSHLWLIRVVAFLRQRAAVQRPGRGRLSVGRHSTAGAPAGRKPLKSRKARNRLLHCHTKWSSGHPRAPPGPAGHSISCPCHQLCWVQMGGARPPAEEGQRRVVGDHHKVRRAAHGGGAAVSTGLDRPTRRRRAISAGCMCARQEFVCVWRCTICDPKDRCVGCPQGCVPQIEIQEPQNSSAGCPRGLWP